MNHTEIINHIIQKNNYKTYLEIGTFNGVNFELIKIDNKECCDPSDKYYNKLTYKMTSDEMFARMPLDKKYDIIFINGLHNELFVHRDIINSLKHLNPGGIICLHDSLAVNYTGSISKQIQPEWNGDVYKAICNLQNLNIEYYTVYNNDYGLTIVKYFDNPYQLNISNQKLDINYDYIFDDTYNINISNHITTQGKFALHIINENELDNIL